MSLHQTSNFEKIQQYLLNFSGGDIFLSRKYFNRGLAIIYFNNPGKKNAITGKMMVDLRNCILELESWKEGKGVLLCGLGGNFCSGGDLAFAKATGTPEEALFMSNWMHDTLKRLKNLPLISFCLIQGPTLGGGAEITTFCDFIIAADDVKFGFVQGKMGIITAWGGASRLVQKIGSKKSLNLFLTSQILTAQGCVDNNIADHVVPTVEALTKSLEWIEFRLQHHHRIVRSFKTVINNATKLSFEDSLLYEKTLFIGTWGGELNRQALAKNIKHIKDNTLQNKNSN